MVAPDEKVVAALVAKHTKTKNQENAYRVINVTLYALFDTVGAVIGRPPRGVGRNDYRD